MSYRCNILQFQNHATSCLFPGFESKIVSVISDAVFVFALLLAAENSSDYSLSRGISVFKPCWQLSPEKIQCMKERSVEERTKDSDYKRDVCTCFLCDFLLSTHAYDVKYLRGKDIQPH